MTTAEPIHDVSGTAFWIAYSRALESQRERPLFHDPWAAELAGTRGKRVMQALQSKESHAWLFTVRTAILDRLILEGVCQHGFDTVVSLGAGLDTRAFRLPLPPSLRWIEVDSAEIFAHKRAVLRDATARCVWEPIALDLSLTGPRQAVLSELGARGSKILVVTEGLLEYLPEAAVRALGRELHALPAVHTWLLNLYANVIYRNTAKQREILARQNAAFVFAPLSGTAFFEDCGFREVEWASIVTQALELERMPAAYRFGARLCLRLGTRKFREQVRRLVGVARLERYQPHHG